MKKICVILTGGTIGSSIETDHILTSSAASYQLIKLYQEMYGNDCSFDVSSPFQLLSENMTPEYWSHLSRVLAQTDASAYDGIIITHGSDTISYTSAFIGLLHYHTPIPVVLIAANYPLEDSRSNGLANFRNAVLFIREQLLTGVFAIFQNNHLENIVYLATRMIASDSYRDQFQSYGGEPLGKMENGHFCFYPASHNPSISEINQPKTCVWHSPFTYTNSILTIHPYPGLDYRSFDLQHRPKAVLHYLYHSSTSCMAGEETALVPFIEKCRQQNIDFYIASVKDCHTTTYPSVKNMINAGAVPLLNISPEAAYAKLLLIYNQTAAPDDNFVRQNIYFEHLPPRSK